MSYLTFADSNIVSGVNTIHISFPISGRWYCDIVCDSKTMMSGNATLSVPNDPNNNLIGFSLHGTIIPDYANNFLDQFKCAFIAGNNTIQNIIKPAHYNSVPASKVISGIIAQTGEELDNSIDPSLLNTIIPSWTVISTNGYQALESIINFIDPSLSRRFLSNGKFWFGYETWTPLDPKYYYNEIHFIPNQNKYYINILSPYIVPGINIPGIGNVNYVETFATATNVQTIIYPNSGGN
jgi:hypothetical protein